MRISDWSSVVCSSDLEEHRFEALRQLQWRSSALSFATVRDLKRTLDERPPHDFLIRKRDADDQLALEALSRLPEIMDRTTAPSRVRLLWDVCQIPDFQQIMSEAHTRLLEIGRAYGRESVSQSG